MGIKINAQDNKNEEYVNAVKGFLEIYMERFFSVLQRNEFFFKFTSNYAKYSKYLNTLKTFTENIIRRRKLEKNSSAQLVREDIEYGIKKKVAFLDLLLELSEDGKVLSDQDIREEVDTFMFEVSNIL